MPVKIPTRMPALTLWQPWAWAVFHAGKRIENRDWAPSPNLLGQTMAIHAAVKRPLTVDLEFVLELTEGEPPMPSRDGFVFGAVVGLARLVGWYDTRGMYDGRRVVSLPEHQIAVEAVGGSPWWRKKVGNVGWVLDEAIELERPVPAVGQQGTWWLSGPLLEQVLDACGACNGCGLLARYELDGRWCHRCFDRRLDEAAQLSMRAS